MSTFIRFECPLCQKRLKAPTQLVGKRVKCPRPGCGAPVRVPGELLDLSEESNTLDFGPTNRPLSPRFTSVGHAQPQLPRARGWTRDWLIGFAILLLIAAGGYGVYWMMGQPSSEEVAVYENFIRTSNELFDMHAAITDVAAARAARPKLMAKAQENLEFMRQRHDMPKSRRKDVLERRYRPQIDELLKRLSGLMDSSKHILIVPTVTKAGDYVVLETFGPPDVETDPAAVNRSKPAPAVAEPHRSGVEESTISKRNDGSDPQPKAVAQSKSPDPKIGKLKISHLTVTRTTFNPPTVEFTIRLDVDGGRLLEAWASVGVKDAGPVLDVFAGAVHQGLIGINGIDLVNPAPDLKAQRVSMKQSPTDPTLYIGKVTYPKLQLKDSVTEFTIVAAIEKDKKILKTNAATVTVDLKTGTVP